MSGITDLGELLRSLHPRLHEGTYVFCTVRAGVSLDDAIPVGTFREDEGVTLILATSDAGRLGLPASIECAWITLDVHSSIEAVGFTAEIARVLTAAGISCNVIAGYYHDHLFVPAGDAEKAMEELEKVVGSR